MTIYGVIFVLPVEDEVWSRFRSLNKFTRVTKQELWPAGKIMMYNTYMPENYLYTQELIMLHQIYIMVYRFLVVFRIIIIIRC